MIIKNKKNKGVTLLEMVLALALLSIIFTVLVRYLQEKAKELKLQTAAHQMENIIDDTTEYVKDNFSSLYNAASAPGANGFIMTSSDGTSPILNDVYGANNSDMIKYTGITPFSEEYVAIIRIPNNLLVSPAPEKNLQVIIYAINTNKKLNWVDSKKLSRLIKNSQGGVVYAEDSPLTPCPTATNFCIENHYGIWQILDNEPGEGQISDSGTGSIQEQITAISTADTTIAPAIAVISNISINQATSPYVSREANTTNRDQNTITTDINISDASGGNPSIFFNGTALDSSDPNKLSGASLTYHDTKKYCEEFDGNPGITIGDYNDLDSSNSITFGDTCRIETVVKQPYLAFESNIPGETAVFTSKGGLKTNLKKTERDRCDITKYKNVLAADPNTGEILKCYATEDYEYGDINDQFFGEWRKIDWKKAFIFLNNNIELFSGADGISSTFRNIGSSLESFVGADIAHEAKWLILQINFNTVGSLDLKSNSVEYPIILNTTADYIPDTTRQALINLPAVTSGNDWLQVKGSASDPGSWSIDLIGYVR